MALQDRKLPSPPAGHNSFFSIHVSSKIRVPNLSLSSETTCTNNVRCETEHFRGYHLHLHFHMRVHVDSEGLHEQLCMKTCLAHTNAVL